MLDEYQREAVSHFDGPCLIIAGPGSGKTKCIVERTKNLIKKGILPGQILVITFTRDAAGEMEMRYLRDKGPGGVHFSTFHSLFYHILSDRFGHESLKPTTQKEKETFYDRLGSDTKKLLENEPATLKKWQGVFSYILIDEYQDINQEQFEIVELLAGQKKNIFAVGDDDQAIYSFRGSDPKFMLSFSKHYPGAAIIRLKNNYRSARQITVSSNSLISHNKIRYEKEICSHRDAFGKMRFIRCMDETKECEYVVEMARKILAGSRDATVGILFRNRYESSLIKEYFMSEHIPFFSGEKLPSLRDHFIFRDLCAMLKLGFGRADDTDVMRAREVFGMDHEKIGMVVGKLSPCAGINYLCKGAGYMNYLHVRAGGDPVEKQKLIQTLNGIKDIFFKIRSREDFFSFIEAGEEKSKDEENKRVGLYTFHGSKGLEFDHVIILDVNEGITPQAKAEDMEEERRVFYVAITRAKDTLTLLTLDRHNNKKVYPSRFIEEMQKRLKNS